MVPHSNTQYGTGGNTGGVKGMVVGSLKSRRTRERVLALTAALSFVGLLLGAPPFRFGETEMPGRNEASAGAPSRALPPPLDDVWQGLTVGVCLCNRPIVSVGSCRHIPLIGYQPCRSGCSANGWSALPPYPPAGYGSEPCPLWYLTCRGYLHPSPTALHC